MLTPDGLACVSSSGEISVQHFDRLIGAKLTRAVQRNQQLLWTDLDGVAPLANS